MRLTLDRSATVALAASLVVVPGLAHAQPADDAVDEVMSEEGTRMYKEAREARMAGDWAHCLARARAAWKLSHKGGIAAIRGECAAELEKWVEAATFLDQCMATPPAKANAAFMEHVGEKLEVARSHVARVTVTVKPDEAAVTIDGQPLVVEDGVTLGHVYLLPGNHTFRAELAGYAPVETTQALKAAETYTVPLSLPPAQLPDDEQDEGSEASKGIPLAIPIVVGIIGLGGIGVGAAGEVLRGNARDDFDAATARLGPASGICLQPSPDVAADCAALDTAVSDHNRFRTVEIAGFVVGGAALAAAAIMLPFADFGGGDDETSDVSIVPSIGPGSFGVGVGGTW